MTSSNLFQDQVWILPPHRQSCSWRRYDSRLSVRPIAVNTISQEHKQTLTCLSDTINPETFSSSSRVWCHAEGHLGGAEESARVESEYTRELKRS